MIILGAYVIGLILGFGGCFLWLVDDSLRYRHIRKISAKKNNRTEASIDASIDADRKS